MNIIEFFQSDRLLGHVSYAECVSRLLQLTTHPFKASCRFILTFEWILQRFHQGRQVVTLYYN